MSCIPIKAAPAIYRGKLQAATDSVSQRVGVQRLKALAVALNASLPITAGLGFVAITLRSAHVSEKAVEGCHVPTTDLDKYLDREETTRNLSVAVVALSVIGGAVLHRFLLRKVENVIGSSQDSIDLEKGVKSTEEQTFGANIRKFILGVSALMYLSGSVYLLYLQGEERNNELTALREQCFRDPGAKAADVNASDLALLGAIMLLVFGADRVSSMFDQK